MEYNNNLATFDGNGDSQGEEAESVIVGAG